VRAVTLEEHRSPSNPLGAKGAGEGPIVNVAGTIGNAIVAALKPLGAEINEMPFSPLRVFEAIEKAKAKRSTQAA
jgi:carbon-monoxide dehydrogenase large subunit